MGLPSLKSLLAIDLDGTLLDRGGRVPEENVRAVRAAREAGYRVVVCTGRGLTESRRAIGAIGQVDPCVVVGGAMIACPVTGATKHRFALPRRIASDAVDEVLAHGFPALVFKDPGESAYDYLVVTGAERHALDPVTEWWFGEMGLRVRRVTTLDEDDHPEHTVRVGACGVSRRVGPLCTAMGVRCAAETVMHHFPAVVAPDDVKTDATGETLHIFEMFSAAATKWSAIRVLAGWWGIGEDRIVAIGDQINDVSMIRGAGVGIAMGNAINDVKAVAGYVTGTNEECGVAFAIDQVLRGEWT